MPLISLEKQRTNYLRSYGLTCKMTSYLSFYGDKSYMSYSYTFNFSNAATPITLKEHKLPEGNVVVNPDYSVSPACEKGGIAIKDTTTKQLWWEAFFINSLEFEQIRPLTKEEIVCYKYIEKYGVYLPLALAIN